MAEFVRWQLDAEVHHGDLASKISFEKIVSSIVEKSAGVLVVAKAYTDYFFETGNIYEILDIQDQQAPHLSSFFDSLMRDVLDQNEAERKMGAHALFEVCYFSEKGGEGEVQGAADCGEIGGEGGEENDDKENRGDDGGKIGEGEVVENVEKDGEEDGGQDGSAAGEENGDEYSKPVREELMPLEDLKRNLVSVCDPQDLPPGRLLHVTKGFLSICEPPSGEVTIFCHEARTYLTENCRQVWTSFGLPDPADQGRRVTGFAGLGVQRKPRLFTTQQFPA
jgi:hypothetical protein